MSAAKLERLLNLTAALLETPRPLTAEQISERVPGYPSERGAFRRAFERDKDDLRQLGIPLRVARVEGLVRATDAYRIPPEEYYLRDPGLEADELAALHLAARVVRLEGVTEALWKLGGEAATSGTLGVGWSAPMAEVPTDERLAALFGALADRHPIRFTYPSARARGPAGTSSAASGARRLVDPYRLDFQRGRWYLSGHDHGRGAPRSFRVDRIDGEVEVLVGQQFPPPAQRHSGVALQPWELGGESAVEAHLLVDADHAAWATDHLGPDAVIERRDDGSVVLAVAVTNRDAFRSFVLTFLDHAEVLSPPELREDLIRWLGRLAYDRPAEVEEGTG